MPERDFELLESLRRHRNGKTRRDLDTLLKPFGFVYDEGGKHGKYTHPSFPELFQTVTRGSGELDPGYVKSAVNLVDRLLVLEKRTENEVGNGNQDQ